MFAMVFDLFSASCEAGLIVSRNLTERHGSEPVQPGYRHKDGLIRYKGLKTTRKTNKKQ